MKLNKILITGSSGTIGTRLFETLLKSGYDVTGVDKKPNKWNSKLNENTILVDLRNRDDIFEKIPNDFDLVIHLAANARVYNLVVDPHLARDNFETIFNILEFTRKNNISKFMFASSREVYGNTEEFHHSEEHISVSDCESPYTASKIAGESLINSYHRCYGIDFIIFRFSNVYGMYDDSDRVIPLFIKLCEEGKDLTIFGKEKLLDFTYIDDAVNGVKLCIDKFNTAKNDVYNLAHGAGTTIFETAEMINKYSNSNSKIIIKDNRLGEVVKCITNISKAKQKLDYVPTTTISEGIQKTIDWYRQNLIS